MGRKVEKIKVILVGPSDVIEEIKIIKNVLEKINTNYKPANDGLEFESLSWLTDASLGISPIPQLRIDKDLDFETADLVIGTFWTKFGTPVLDAKSGTEHEI